MIVHHSNHSRDTMKKEYPETDIKFYVFNGLMKDSKL